jgi:hypothetical protein
MMCPKKNEMTWEEEFPDDQAIVREVEERGAKRERERIIALLDKTLIYDEPAVMDRDRLIALIKG